MLLVIFVELRVAAGRSRTRAGSPQAVSTAVLCRGIEKNNMVRAGHGRGMASVNPTQPHCVNQMGKTHSKPLMARHGRGTAWARHAMCESSFAVTHDVDQASGAQ
jgi:hypothetical protein